MYIHTFTSVCVYMIAASTGTHSRQCPIVLCSSTEQAEPGSSRWISLSTDVISVELVSACRAQETSIRATRQETEIRKNARSR